MRRVSQHLCRPLVQAGSADLGCYQRGTVHFRWNAQHDFAARWLFNGFANLGAGFDVVISRFCKRCTKALHGVGMEPDNIRAATRSSMRPMIRI